MQIATGEALEPTIATQFRNDRPIECLSQLRTYPSNHSKHVAIQKLTIRARQCQKM